MIKKRFFKTIDECEVTFEYANNEAQQAALVSDFNGWQPLSMKKAKKRGGPFRVKVRMPKDGQYQFRYLINGRTWTNDVDADEERANEFGESNSVVNTFAQQ